MCAYGKAQEEQVMLVLGGVDPYDTLIVPHTLAFRVKTCLSPVLVSHY